MSIKEKLKEKRDILSKKKEYQKKIDGLKKRISLMQDDIEIYEEIILDLNKRLKIKKGALA